MPKGACQSYLVDDRTMIIRGSICLRVIFVDHIINLWLIITRGIIDSVRLDFNIFLGIQFWNQWRLQNIALSGLCCCRA